MPKITRSFTLDAKVVEAAAKIAPDGNMSRLVNDALSREVKLANYNRFVDELLEEVGPIPQEVYDDIDAQLRGEPPRRTPPLSSTPVP
ncbi:MAG: type II toxin-antitoxin system CcdA family antitoxin [Solirubrobacteraceae bacterium MAG38_C4-C5]|nr:type II toxin-antitoxin system CcdA family antitoxin [Candidatus Siliceabacter maunaloa]